MAFKQVVNTIKYRYGRPQITTGQMGFGVVHCCLKKKYTYNSLIDMGGLRLQRAIESDIQ